MPLNMVTHQPAGEIFIYPQALTMIQQSGLQLRACDGAALNRSVYSALFEVLDTNFGEGDGTTTFNIPDYSTTDHRGNPKANNEHYYIKVI